MGTIDWRLAQHVGELVSGISGRGSATPPPLAGADLGIDPEALQAPELAGRITSYTGLAPRDAVPALELVDRPRWIAANLATMRPLLEPLSERMGSGLGPLAGMARSASGALIGVQIGVLTGMLSQRVLGQYDIALLDPSPEPRLLLVSPNLAQAAQNLRVDREELVRWVTIHEVTHAVQFGGAPWLREHLAGIIRELMDSMQLDVEKSGGMGLRDLLALGDLASRPDVAAMRRQISDMLAKARSGELLRITLGEDRWQLIDRMQATMSLIEGHAEHVMDAVGAELLPSLPRLRSAMTRRRQMRPLPWRVLERLLGLELKMRQYEVGRRFCDTVVSEAGPAALAPAWRSPEGLPTSAELESPLSWLARTA
ncbi:MAG: zinc-dependent metalloprotease [Solirubrobacteraceae bacterium]